MTATAERHMIRIDRKPQLFSFRVAGLIFHEGHVLVQQIPGEDYWAMPGGRAEIGETSARTIVREMQEELGCEVEVKRLLWTVENFYADGDYRYHELGFYYLLTLSEDFPFHPQDIVHTVVDGPTTVQFRWLPATQAAFEEARVFPLLLRERIENLPASHEHVVSIEEGYAP
ncbi:NUDIX hydrolase [Rhizobium sp. RU36D]|uniref:NUDIX hydrolase n=1 Tax=Rhizobium sp. RU36D TaxID=1907415 RepID=UPI0009D8C571|nr:NUDIX hydrolase [Rhizobium sp. RU36D]SMC41315.1 ADP-ribose pyrophosphatase YjhB, NUDIX family [Rhizobium sp. RU36D]